jgi:tetratricopeptide (TPR) repeat protein
MLLVSAVAYPQLSNEEKFREGSRYYTEGNFEKALENWLDIYNTGYRSPELEYNIGNSYFKLNDIPGAILFYERAYKRKPSDEDINYNLQIARTLVVDRFNEIPELFFVRWFNFLSLALPANSWAKASLAAFILSLLFLSVYLYSVKYRIKVAGFWLAVVLFVFSGTSLSFTLRNKTLVYDSKEAVVFSPQVSGKSSPDNSGTDLFVIHEGTRVKIEDKVGEWYGIRLSDGNKGWIPSGSVKII